MPTGQVTKRQQQALDLRVKGYTFPQIAAELKVTTKTAHELFTKAMANGVVKEQVESVLETELLRLDQMMRVCTTILAKETVEIVTKDGAVVKVAMDDELRLKTLDRIVKIQERRSKLLGMERTRVDATVDGPWASFLADVITGADDEGTTDGKQADAAG